MQQLPKYALITPARNEGDFIELTIQSMIAQTHLPLKWVIVNDGSTDSTEAVAREYANRYPWIELLDMPQRAERHFAGKAHAFKAGYERVSGTSAEIIGNLDADVSFEPDHFEFLINRMAENPGIGVAGAPFREGDFQYDYRYSNIENVWGGCQLFRRECYEAIGGYVPLKGGCIDHVAVLSARFHGWQTRTFTEKVCVHHRRMGTAMQGALRAKFKMGVKDYTVGNHPVWEMARAIYQMRHRPFVIGALAMGTGYFWSMARRAQVSLSPELVAFVRREQMARLKKVFRRGSMPAIRHSTSPSRPEGA
jgi:poly-beta-1,6-N-acetyl-D-glucosamine synthase